MIKSVTEMPTNKRFECIFKGEDEHCYFYHIGKPGDKFRAYREEGDTVFIFAKGKRRYGYRKSTDIFDKYFTIIPPKDETEEWHKRIRRALKVMNESGLWSDLKPMLESLLLITLDDKREILNMHHTMWNIEFDKSISEAERQKKRENILQIMEEKYPFALYTDDKGGRYINSDFVSDFSNVSLKTMYFGRQNGYYKAKIKEALSNKQSYKTGRVRVQYDNSFSYNADLGKAWYSEEYKDCGNGHYYLALNENVAWFYEND